MTPIQIGCLVILILLLVYIVNGFGFKKKDLWIYGECNDLPARKHRKKGNVQFVLWKAGEQGHKEDYWHNMDSSWWDGFKENKKSNINE